MPLAQGARSEVTAEYVVRPDAARNVVRASADYAGREAADPTAAQERAMSIFRLIHVMIAQAFYRWALRKMNPLHPDLPQIVLRQQELADEARRLVA